MRLSACALHLPPWRANSARCRCKSLAGSESPHLLASNFPQFDAAAGPWGQRPRALSTRFLPMLLPLAGGMGTVVKFGEFIVILELHRWGLTIAAIAS